VFQRVAFLFVVILRSKYESANVEQQHSARAGLEEPTSIRYADEMKVMRYHHVNHFELRADGGVPRRLSAPLAQAEI